MQPIGQPGTGPDDITPESQDTHTAGSTESDAETGRLRRIRSPVRRAGRTSAGQQRAIDELDPCSQLSYTTKPLDWDAAFTRADAKHIFEIGFGMGETATYITQLRPDDGFLGVEVYEPGVGALLELIGEREVGNIRIISHDAVGVLTQMIPGGALDGIHVFFPDPWHKKRHNGQRLIQSPFAARLAAHLKPDGYLHYATDREEYTRQMPEVLSSEPTLENIVGDFAPRPNYRPVTGFEERGLRLGHSARDVVFCKRGWPRPHMLARVSVR